MDPCMVIHSAHRGCQRHQLRRGLPFWLGTIDWVYTLLPRRPMRHGPRCKFLLPQCHILPSSIGRKTSQRCPCDGGKRWTMSPPGRLCGCARGTRGALPLSTQTPPKCHIWTKFTCIGALIKADNSKPSHMLPPALPGSSRLSTALQVNYRFNPWWFRHNTVKLTR